MSEQSVAVIESRLSRLEGDCKDLNMRLIALSDKFANLRSDLRVLEVRVATYAAAGALVGGGVVSVVVNLISAYFNKGG